LPVFLMVSSLPNFPPTSEVFFMVNDYHMA
jgi:hypothetical protein